MPTLLCADGVPLGVDVLFIGELAVLADAMSDCVDTEVYCPVSSARMLVLISMWRNLSDYVVGIFVHCRKFWTSFCVRNPTTLFNACNDAYTLGAGPDLTRIIQRTVVEFTINDVSVAALYKMHGVCAARGKPIVAEARSPASLPIPWTYLVSKGRPRPVNAMVWTIADLTPSPHVVFVLAATFPRELAHALLCRCIKTRSSDTMCVHGLGRGETAFYISDYQFRITRAWEGYVLILEHVHRYGQLDGPLTRYGLTGKVQSRSMYKNGMLCDIIPA